MAKQLFPGVSEQDIINQEQQKIKAAEQERKKQEAMKKAAQELKQKQEQEKQQQDFEKKVKYLYRKFGKFRKDLNWEIKHFIKRQSIMLGLFYSLFIFGSLPTAEKGINLLRFAVSASDEKAADKKITKKIYEADEEDKEIAKAYFAYFMNPLKETYNFPAIFDKNAYGFDENYDLFNYEAIRAWIGLISVIWCAALSVSNIKSKKKGETTHIRQILEAWENNDFKSMDFLININKETDLNGMAEQIFSHLSKKDKTMFEKMMNGEAKFDVKTAVAIMEGHFKSHPEDVKLVFDTFDERSIPDAIKEKYASIIHR